MALTKQEKEKIIEELSDKVGRQKSMVFADFTRLKVKELSALRKLMKKQDCEFKVAKKTLVALVLKKNNIDVDLKKMQGEIALGFGYKDEISPFRIIHDFAKGKETPKILGGFMQQTFCDQSQALALAELPSREEILAKLLLGARYQISAIFNSLQRNLNILKVRS